RKRNIQQMVNCQNRPLKRKSFVVGNNIIFQNMIMGSRSQDMDCAESITFTTIGDYTFFGKLATLAERWRAPISIAVYSLGYDVNTTLDAIQYYRKCLPASQLIREFVSFHLFLPVQHWPDHVKLEVFGEIDWPVDCVAFDEVLSPGLLHAGLYLAQANMTYPINVGRNVARQAVNTHFILACDIELYPSLGFVEQFLDMVHHNSSILALDPDSPPRVYPLPVFEIAENARVPDNKTELMDLLSMERAHLFHKKICVECHTIPGFNEWTQTSCNASEKLRVFSVALRQEEFRHWEPSYVSDNKEPMFDERVTWEGQSNKRIQGYAMCLMGYEYHVLHPAFLVHHPGIKKLRINRKRFKLIEKTMRMIKMRIEPEYEVLYGSNDQCTT
ncbi:hypothetical protein KR222_009257, partial [Zaprionus bogoriensis]